MKFSKATCGTKNTINNAITTTKNIVMNKTDIDVPASILFQTMS